MRKFRVLQDVLSVTGTGKILYGFLAFLLTTAYALYIVEHNAGNPAINNLFDAFYFSVVTVSTVGFGDIVVTTFIGRVLSMMLMGYGVLVIGLVTGVFASVYDELSRIKNKETLDTFVDQLENLEELSHEELVKLSRKIRRYRGK